MVAGAVCSLTVEPGLTGSGTGSWRRRDQLHSYCLFVSEGILMRTICSWASGCTGVFGGVGVGVGTAAERVGGPAEDNYVGVGVGAVGEHAGGAAQD